MSEHKNRVAIWITTIPYDYKLSGLTQCMGTDEKQYFCTENHLSFQKSYLQISYSIVVLYIKGS